MKLVDLLRVMKFVESDEGLLSYWGRSVFSCAGIKKVACLCKFDESDEGNLVQKYGVWLVMIEKNLGG